MDQAGRICNIEHLNEYQWRLPILVRYSLQWTRYKCNSIRSCSRREMNLLRAVHILNTAATTVVRRKKHILPDWRNPSMVYVRGDKGCEHIPQEYERNMCRRHRQGLLRKNWTRVLHTRKRMAWPEFRCLGHCLIDLPGLPSLCWK